MEWLSGEDLGKRLRRGPLAISETIALLRQVALRLHSPIGDIGVIHRDLKPSNLPLPFLVDGTKFHSKSSTLESLGDWQPLRS